MRRLSLFAILVLVLTGGGWFGLGTFERKAVYPFDPTRIDPETLGLHRIQEVLVPASGHQIVVWVAQPDPGRPTVFYLHGNAGNLANRAWRFQQLLDRGYGLIAPAYRGSSGSTGRASEAAITTDMRRIYRQMDGLSPGLQSENVIVYGESLGTGVALKLLTGDDISTPGGVVLEAPYTSLPDVVRHVYPQLESLIPRMKNIWDSQTHITQLQTPLLVLHGADDDLIPLSQGRAVFEAAASNNKQFIEIPGAGHSDTWRDAVLPKLWRFIERP